MQYRYGELFSGPGGLSLGAINAEYTTNKGEKHEIMHLWASDYDEDSCKTYRLNICPKHLESVHHCDVKDLQIDSLPQIDILAFGFPCNDFSIVGETKGMEGEYGMLYQYGVKVLNQHNPRAFVAENVSGLKGANGGKAWAKITYDLENSGEGYDLYVHHYHFEHYGVPQMRHRYIIVGIRKNLKLSFKHPEPFTIGNPRTCYQALHEPEIPTNATHHEIRPLQSQVQERLSFIKPGDNAWSDDIPKHLRLNVKGAFLSNIYRRMRDDLPAYTITGSGGGGTHGYHWSDNRALTNREKARIQTFPDDFEFVGGVTSVRKQIGMAVPPEGAKIIFTKLLECLSSDSEMELVESIDLRESAKSETAYLNLCFNKGRLNTKTGGYKSRPWNEVELRLGNKYPDIPRKFTAFTSNGYTIKMKRSGGGPKGKPELGVKDLSGEGMKNRQLFGDWIKGRLIDARALKMDHIIDYSTFDEYGSYRLEFYRISDDEFLLRFDPN